MAAGLGLSVGTQLSVLDIGGADGEGAGDGGVGDVLAGYIDGALGRGIGWWGFFGGFVVFCEGQGGNGETSSKKSCGQKAEMAHQGDLHGGEWGERSVYRLL